MNEIVAHIEEASVYKLLPSMDIEIPFTCTIDGTIPSGDKPYMCNVAIDNIGGIELLPPRHLPMNSIRDYGL